MKKKVLICALISAAAISTAAIAGCNLFGGGGGDSGDGSVVQDNMKFVLKDDGTYELDEYLVYLEDRDGEYQGNGETVNVPETVNGKTVTSLADIAFGSTAVKSITLPDTVTALPERVFENCVYLDTVNLSAVSSVGKSAFYGCTALESIEFKSGLTEIGESAFVSCPALTTVTLPDTVTTLGENCFRECPIESINTKGVEVLGKTAFYYCENLTSLSLPNVKSIGEQAMRSCAKLAELSIGDKLEVFGDNAIYDCNLLTKVSINSPVPAKMFQWNKVITDVTLGESVTSIGEMAFGYCSEIKNITLPATLTELGKDAFNQSGLTSVNIPASLNAIGESAFYGTKITSLNIPASVKTIGDGAFESCRALTEITFNEGLESIGANAFEITGAETLDIVLPSTVKSVGDGCFRGITANKLIINETVETVGANVVKGAKVKELAAPATTIGSASSRDTVLTKVKIIGTADIPAYAYRYCTALKAVTIGDGVKRIGERAFTALEELRLGGVEYMGDDALGDTSALKYTKTENGVNYIDNWIISSDFTETEKTERLDLNGVKGVYRYAFYEATDLKELVLIENASELLYIGENAFGQTGITSLYIPSSLKTWNRAFANCSSLTNVTVGEGIEEIPASAFSGCSQLSTVNLASARSLKRIGSDAFNGCKELRTVTLEGVEEIGRNAFSNCTSLMLVQADSVKIIGDSAFSGCSNLSRIDLPASVTEIGEGAFGGVATVIYDGTKEQWEAVTGGNKVYSDTAEFTVEFNDGTSETYTPSSGN